MKSAVLFALHGSRDADGTREFLRLVDLFRARDPGRVVEFGVLEFARPTIAEGFERCVARGASAITVLPGMLMAAGHVNKDIPCEMDDARRRYPGVEFHYARHLHLHAKIIELCRVRLADAERSAKPIDRKDTLLLVVGRGSSDPDANGDICKLARMLGEGMGYGWSAACYSGVTTPLLPEALARCHRIGFARVVVLPFFLFTGVLEKRARQQTIDFGQRHGEVVYLCANYLGAHPLLVDAFADRAAEVVAGSPNMNSEL